MSSRIFGSNFGAKKRALLIINGQVFRYRFFDIAYRTVSGEISVEDGIVSTVLDAFFEVTVVPVSSFPTGERKLVSREITKVGRRSGRIIYCVEGVWLGE